MNITADLLAQLSRQSGFDDTAIEKTLRSLLVVDAINQHEALQGEFILYGGTALHMFHGPTERLSVDLDLMYCGGPDLASRERMHGALKSVLQSFGDTQPPRLSLSRQCWCRHPARPRLSSQISLFACFPKDAPR